MVAKSGLAEIIGNLIELEEKIDALEAAGIDAEGFYAPVADALFIALGEDLTEVAVRAVEFIMDEEEEDELYEDLTEEEMVEDCDCAKCACCGCCMEEEEEEDDEEAEIFLVMLDPTHEALIPSFTWEEAYDLICAGCTVVV